MWIKKNWLIEYEKKTQLYLPKNEYFLLPQDILAVVDYLIKTNFGTGTC